MSGRIFGIDQKKGFVSMKPATKNRSGTSQKGLRFSLRRLLGTVVIFAVGLPIVLYLISTPGNRIYFSPDTLQTKATEERVLMGTGFPVLRISKKPEKTILVDFLEEKGYWKGSFARHPRWLLTANHNSQWRDGHSMFHSEFHWRKEIWILWSQKYPKRAAVMWPLVLEILRKKQRERDLQGLAAMVMFYFKSYPNKQEIIDAINKDQQFFSVSTEIKKAFETWN